MIQPWPALSSVSQSSQGTLRYARGVHGKVHRAASDYRWIAVTPGLEKTGVEILNASAFGTEDYGQKAAAWARLENGYVAVHAYPSRARDAAGRPGGIEKQVVHWIPDDSSTSPALAAFFLLEVIAGFDDSIWWKSWDSPDWSRPEFFLPLDESACPPIRWDTVRLRALIDAGIRDLRATVREDSLARFYQLILDRRRPAVLNIEPGSLSSAALAALLLPLPAETAAEISLCGVLPARELRMDTLRHWSGIVCFGNASPDSFEPGDMARSLARALLAADPGSIEAITPGQEQMSPSAKYLSVFLGSERRSLQDPPESHAWAPIRPHELAGLIAEIRRVDQEAASGEHFPGDTDRQHARERHLRLKGDLARAWLYACAPGEHLIKELAPRDDAVPPALWFGPLVPRPLRLWERFPPDEFARLVEHSLAPERQHHRVLQWLDELRKSEGLDLRVEA